MWHLHLSLKPQAPDKIGNQPQQDGPLICYTSAVSLFLLQELWPMAVVPNWCTMACPQGPLLPSSLGWHNLGQAKISCDSHKILHSLGECWQPPSSSVALPQQGTLEEGHQIKFGDCHAMELQQPIQQTQLSICLGPIDQYKKQGNPQIRQRFVVYLAMWRCQLKSSAEYRVSREGECICLSQSGIRVEESQQLVARVYLGQGVLGQEPWVPFGSCPHTALAPLCEAALPTRRPCGLLALL